MQIRNVIFVYYTLYMYIIIHKSVGDITGLHYILILSVKKKVFLRALLVDREQEHPFYTGGIDRDEYGSFIFVPFLLSPTINIVAFCMAASLSANENG